MKFFNMFRQPYLDGDDGTNLGGGGIPTDTAGQQTEPGEASTTGDEGQQQAQTQQPQVLPAIKVKFNHEEREIPYEEAVTHIQKGMNYEKAVERARQEARDAWVAEQGYEWKGKPIKSEAEYKQALKEQELESKIRAQYSNVPDEIVNELLEGKRFREQYQTEKQTAEQKAAEQKMYADFLEAYPDVKSTDIPAEVWKEVKAGKNLTDAYVRYENKQLKDQLTSFQQQQQTAQANQANAAASTGSVKANGLQHDIISDESINAHANDMPWMMKNYNRIEEFYKKKKG
jgi:hypothetical protein